MRRIGAGMSKWTSAIAVIVRSARLLHPLAERLAALDHAGRIGVEVGDRGVDAGAGEDPLGGGVHQVGQPLQLGPAPGVGLVEVDLRAEEVAARERVDLPPDPLALRALRLELVGEVQPERRGGGARGTRQGSQLGAVAALQAVDEAEVEVARLAGLPGPAAHLLGHLGVLPRRDDVALARLVGERHAQALEGGGYAGQAGRDGRDGLRALGRHQVEDPADLVQGAPQHRHARAVDARLLQLDLQPGPLEERVLRRRLAVVDGGRGLDGGDRAPGQCLAGVEAGGGEVGQLVLVPGHPDRGGGQRVEGAEVLDVGVAEGVDPALVQEGFGHAGDPMPSPDDLRVTDAR